MQLTNKNTNIHKYLNTEAKKQWEWFIKMSKQLKKDMFDQVWDKTNWDSGDNGSM